MKDIIEFVLSVLGASLIIYINKKFGFDLNESMFVLLFMIYLKV